MAVDEKSGLEDVENEVVSRVVRLFGRIEVVPFLVVDRNPHLLRVAMIQASIAPVVFISVVILRIEDVRIMVKAFPIVR